MTAVLFITLHGFQDCYCVQTSLSENTFFFLLAFPQRDTLPCSKTSKVWNISVGHLVGCLGSFLTVYSGDDSWENAGIICDGYLYSKKFILSVLPDKDDFTRYDYTCKQGKKNLL